MRVIFLDIDGCLVTARAMRIARELRTPGPLTNLNKCFDEDCVNVLNRFIEASGAKVVVSSTWRIGQTIASMQDIMNKNKVKCEVIGLTGFDKDGIRGLEIWEWLLSNKGKWDDYLVIDDDSRDLVDYIPERKFVHVSNGLMGKGLQEDHLRSRKWPHWAINVAP